MRRSIRAMSLGLGLSMAAATQAASVGFDPVLRAVTAGSHFTVDIVGRDFEQLAGGAIDFKFNPAILRVDQVAVAPYWDFLPDAGHAGSGGTWRGVAFDTFANSPAQGNFTIASLSMTALTDGASSLSLLPTSTFFSTTNELSPTFTDGAVTVGAGQKPTPVVTFLPPAGPVRVGDRFDIRLVGTQFEKLAGGTLDLSFDGNVLAVDGVTIDGRWDFSPEPGHAGGAGRWSGIGFDVFNNNPYDGDLDLAVLHLIALGAGQTTLALLPSSAVFGPNSAIDAQFDGIALTVEAVPLPRSLILLLSAILGLPLAKRNRFRTDLNAARQRR